MKNKFFIMLRKHQWNIVFCFFLIEAGINNLHAQDASGITGKIIIEKKDNSGNSDGLTPSQMRAVTKNILNVRDIILAMPSLPQRTGYNLHAGYLAGYSKNLELPWLKDFDPSLEFDLEPLYFEKGKLLDDPEASSSIRVNINTFVYPETYTSFLGEVNYPEPVFFMLNGVKIDSSDKNDIVLTIPGNNPVHIITNGKSLFVPYKQGQYLHFKIVRDQKFLQDAEKVYEKDKKNLDGMNKQIAGYSRKGSLKELEKIMFTTDTTTIKGIRQLVSADEANLKVLKNRLTKDQHQFTIIDKQKPAFIDINIKGTSNDDLVCPDLADENDPGKEELWTINPGYINTGLPPAAIQIIAMTYLYNWQMTLKSMQAAAKKFFAAIDYNKLKSLISQ